MQLNCQVLINFPSLNLDLKKGVFLANYLTKNSKIQSRFYYPNTLIINNKESPTFWWGSLQLTTYETQSSLLVAAGALSFTAAGGLL